MKYLNKKLAVMATLTVAAALTLGASNLLAQTVVPGGNLHVGALEIAGIITEQGTNVASAPKTPTVMSAKRATTAGVKDNTRIDVCVAVDGGGRTVLVSFTSSGFPIIKSYAGSWVPNQPYKPCPYKIVPSVKKTDHSPDSTPPSDHYVKSTQPADGETNVSPGVMVQAEFSEPVAGNTVNVLNFVLWDPNGNRVPAAVSYDPQTFTAILDPEIDLASGLTYMATINVRDVHSQFMTSPHSWSFTIGSCSGSQVGVPGVTCAPPSS